MKNLSNKLLPALLLNCMPTLAANLVLFDDPSVSVMEHGNEVRGHYLGRSTKSYLLGDLNFFITCEFLFKEHHRTTDTVLISGWESAIFMPSDPRLTYGLIRIHDDTWKIIFKGVPGGCRSKDDGDKLAAQPSPCCNPADLVERGGLYVKPVQRIRAVGFRILDKDHAFIKLDPGTAPQEKQRIERGSVVAVLKLSKSAAHVRYVVPNTGDVVHGWMNRDALVDPFKPEKKARR